MLHEKRKWPHQPIKSQAYTVIITLESDNSAYGKRKYIVDDSPKTPLSTDDENKQE